jgi:hypothetical protein
MILQLIVLFEKNAEIKHLELFKTILMKLFYIQSITNIAYERL